VACEGCAGSVSKILQKTGGVVEVVQVSVKDKTATINVDSSFNADNTIQALNKAGFTAKSL